MVVPSICEQRLVALMSSFWKSAVGPDPPSAAGPLSELSALPESTAGTSTTAASTPPASSTPASPPGPEPREYRSRIVFALAGHPPAPSLVWMNNDPPPAGIVTPKQSTEAP